MDVSAGQRDYTYGIYIIYIMKKNKSKYNSFNKKQQQGFLKSLQLMQLKLLLLLIVKLLHRSFFRGISFRANQYHIIAVHIQMSRLLFFTLYLQVTKIFWLLFKVIYCMILLISLVTHLLYARNYEQFSVSRGINGDRLLTHIFYSFM